jgi:hypothetical protein
MILLKSRNSSEGIPCSLRKSRQGGIGRSEFSVENSRSPESRQILQRSRGVTVSLFSSFKFGRNRTVGSGSTRTVGSLAKSHFVDSRVEGLKPLPQDSRGRERRSPEGAKGFV